MPPVVYGLSSGTTPLPKSGLIMTPPTFSANWATSSDALRHPRPARMATRFPASIIEAAASSSAATGMGYVGLLRSPLCPATFALLRFPFLASQLWMSLGIVTCTTSSATRPF